MKTEPTTDTGPLSPMQQGMVFHSLSAREPGVDIEQIYCTLRESIDARVFERAWRHVIGRHAILRTSFLWRGRDAPVQKVNPSVDFEFQQQDWRGFSAATQRGVFDEWLEIERRRGFDLAEPSLQRVALFRIGESEWRFIWTFHHLLLDGRSVVLVLNEVFAFYEAFQRGETFKLPLPREFQDFVTWLNDPSRDSGKAEQFWREYLKQFANATPLPASRTIDGAGSIRGEQQIALSATATAKLKALAKEHKLTLNTFVQGAWALLLSRYTGEEDVVFGAVRAGRHSTIKGAESIVGLCINTVPVRAHMPGDVKLLPWLGDLRNAWIAQREFEQTPLVKIQAWSQIPPARPLFETIFNFQDPSWDSALRAQGGKWSNREFGICSQSNYPLVVDAYGGDVVLVKILYHRSRFGDDTIARMLGHYQTLLEGMATNPEAKLCEIPILDEAEKAKILIEWNNTHIEFPADRCVHQLFEEQVQRQPDALAVADEKKQWSYRELNEHAESIAAALRTFGVGPDVCVGVCLERSVEMVAAKLAVWKAGGAYVPLDPSYPKERLAFMLENAQTPVLLTQRSLLENLRSGISNLQVFCVEDAPRVVNTKGEPGAVPRSSNLAYVIYTSGSTGRPKGVEITHASLMNLIAWHQRTYSVTPTDRATQIATPAFDASVWELWPYLTAGASIHIPAEDIRLSPRKLSSWLAKHKITLAFIPTPILEKMLDDPWPADGALRAVLTGGDKLHRAAGKNLPCVLINHYGPTENTVVTTESSVPPIDESLRPPPIGRPISNTQVYILDRNLAPVPVGVLGELFIGGSGLARGYRHEPALTAEKFIPNPFSDNSLSPRLYRTGDLACWRSDGQVEFLGRMDHQVKIRGQRIELGEIESILARHPHVRETVVVAHEGKAGEGKLAAYIVLKTGCELKARELQEFLKQKLPEAMVPSAFIFLDVLPLSPNGKVDRQALPPQDFKVESDKPYVAPGTPVEEALTDMWHEVLGVNRISVHDNFFELGGHSLTATQVISRIFGAFQVDVSLNDLFDSPTIAGLAEKIAGAEAGATQGAIPEAIDHDNNLTVSFAQERLWFMEQLQPGIPFNNIPIAIHIEGPLNQEALDKSLTEIFRRHVPLRSVFTNVYGNPVIQVAPVKKIRIPVIDLSAMSGNPQARTAERLMNEQAAQPFDLTEGPLMRTTLLRLGDEEHMLALTTHHIICDGWSLGIFYRELAALYEAFSRGQASPLPQLRDDYLAFVHRQRERMQGDMLKSHLEFWQKQLVGAKTVLDLPTDRPRQPLQTYQGAIKIFSLPKELAEKVARLGRERNATTFMVLLAAFQTLLYRWTGQEDILVGSPTAGRTRVETEGLIGLFLNTLILRGDLSGDLSFSDLLQRIRGNVLAAFGHQELPFEQLVNALQPARDLSRSPLFQVMFVLQNEPLRPLELARLKLTPLPLHSGTAKFDLMVSVDEHADGLTGFVEYNTDLFDGTTIERLVGNYQAMLEAIVAVPQQPISRLPLLTAAEQKQIIESWNNTSTEFAKDKCLHQLFEDQVKRTPDETALFFEDQQLAYHELNERANRVACELQVLGVGPDVRVGIYVKRSLEMMAGLLGVLKAGGCYVPLDPTYPKERIAFMIEDADIKVLLTQRSLHDHFGDDVSGLKLLYVDEICQAHDPIPVGNPISEVRPENLAYVIYTSGSTGRPKGVMVSHRNVVNFFTGMDGILGTTTGVWLAVTSISFDISVLELFWTLVRGFKVVIQPDGEMTSDNKRGNDPEKPSGQWRSVPEQITWHGVTHMQCTPSLAGTLVLAPASLAAMRRLNKLLLGGETLPVSLAQRLCETVQGEVINMYGPTETTVWSAARRVDKIVGNSISIGRPIANTQIYILDQHFQPVPVGVPGEIFIGGEGVARGYLDRQEMTAEKFVPNPFVRDGAAQSQGVNGSQLRLYRTGDLGRFRRDGNIEFLGRLDHQVKIRGQRIELGEIETAFRRLPTVREIVVVARESSPGDKRLVAYFTFAAGAKPTATELRRFAQDRLPEAMVPSQFVFLEKMPLTPNGKIDRNALPASEGQRPELETNYIAPRDGLEKSIAKVWQELLRVEKVGSRDNFFDLGGNSLLVVQVQSRLRDVINRDLPIVKLFQHPTIHSLAGYLSEEPSSTFARGQVRGLRKQAALARQQTEEAEVTA